MSLVLQPTDGEKRFETEFYVEGVATRFNQPYFLFEWDGVKYYEEIDRQALEGADMSDVIMQYDHEGRVLARMSNNTLGIEVTDDELQVYADLSRSNAAKEMYSDIKEALVTKMSWAFTVGEDSFNRETKTHRILKVKKVYDVSAVSIPANNATEISARAYVDGVIERERQELAKRLELAKRKYYFLGRMLIMEIKDMTLEQVISRKAELTAIVEKSQDVTEIENATNELKELNVHKTFLDGIAARKRAAQEVLAGMNSAPPPTTSDIEKRAAEFVRTKKMRIGTMETRAIIADHGSIARPTSVGDVNDPFNTISSIIDLVQVDDLNGVGAHKEPIITAWQSAGAGTENTEATTSDPTFTMANLTPHIIDVLTYVSKYLQRQTPIAYEAKVRQGALIALRRKLVHYIIKGDGNDHPYGIYNAVDYNAVSLTQELLLEASTFDEKLLRKIVFAYGGDENVGAGARLFLNKNDLIAFGDVRGNQEKKAVYEIIPDGSNPNTGVIKDAGLSVPYVLCSDCTQLAGTTKSGAKLKTMIYGAPGAYKVGLFGDYEVSVSEDYKFGEGMLSIRGDVLVGGNVVMDKGFVVVTLGTM